ncbi:MAG TPA: TadE/TadG family type IV pilus assembly protein [Roseiarcus sp.]|nr:TadE/TadG family type IV pilus assembly protein [Roseiarcus sp.]
MLLQWLKGGLARIYGNLRDRLPSDYVRRTDGMAAVEFALVAAPFFALIIAILELALIFVAQAALETAVEETARLVLTGQALSSGLTQAQFQADVCAKLPSPFVCSGVMVNLVTASSFSTAVTTAPTLTYNASGQVNNAWQYQVGGPGSIEVMQVMYQWPVFPGPLNLNFANLSNGSYLLMATSVFRNEP